MDISSCPTPTLSTVKQAVPFLLSGVTVAAIVLFFIDSIIHVEPHPCTKERFVKTRCKDLSKDEMMMEISCIAMAALLIIGSYYVFKACGCIKWIEQINGLNSLQRPSQPAPTLTQNVVIQA